MNTIGFQLTVGVLCVGALSCQPKTGTESGPGTGAPSQQAIEDVRVELVSLRRGNEELTIALGRASDERRKLLDSISELSKELESLQDNLDEMKSDIEDLPEKIGLRDSGGSAERGRGLEQQGGAERRIEPVPPPRPAPDDGVLQRIEE